MIKENGKITAPARRNPRFGAIRPLTIFPLAGIMLVAALAMGARSARAANDPQQQVQDLTGKVLPILRDTATPLPQRRKELIDLLAGHFDFSDMARMALGYHWRDLSADQRSEFVQLFTAFIENAYMGKIQDYKGQDIQVTGERTLQPGYSEVQSRIVQPNKQPIRLNYLLKQDSNGDWKVYDVTVDAISIIANYRNQFNRVINDQGFDKLMADMRTKQEQLQESLGS